MCKGDILGQEMTFLLSCYSTRYRPLAKWDTAQMSWATHSRWRDPAVPSLPFEDVAKISATYCLTMTITTTGNTNPHFPNIPTYPGLKDNKTNTTSVFQPCFTTLFTQPPLSLCLVSFPNFPKISLKIMMTVVYTIGKPWCDLMFFLGPQCSTAHFFATKTSLYNRCGRLVPQRSGRAWHVERSGDLHLWKWWMTKGAIWKVYDHLGC